jgi:hypothetical protein
MASVLLFCLACEIDNYNAPDGGLQGRIIDEETGENVPQPVPSDFGLRLRFYEAGRENSLEQHFYAQNDGSFCNSQIFNGPIRLVLEQRNFLPLDTLYIHIQGQTQCDIQVIPYLRFHTKHTLLDGHKITIRFSVSRSDKVTTGNCKIKECRLLWNASPQIDNQSVNYAGVVLLSLLYPDEQFLSDAHTMQLDLSTIDNQVQLKRLAHLIRGNGNRIYLRLCAITLEETDNDSNYYYNYSEIIPIQIDINSLLITIQ